MPTVPLCCDNIGELNGTLARAIVDAAINDAVRDLEDRAEYDRKPRKVTIELTFSLLNNGQVATAVEAFAKVPRRRTNDTIANIRRTAGNEALLFSTGSPDQPDQLTIDDLPSKRRDDDDEE